MIDNNSSTTTMKTEFNASVDNITVGTVTIRNGGVLEINHSTGAITVNGGWVNTSTENDVGQVLTDGAIIFASPSNAQYVQNKGEDFYNIVSSNTHSSDRSFSS